MKKVKKMAMGGLGGVPSMPAMPGNTVGNAPPAAKPMVAPAPTIAPQSAPLAPAPTRAAVAPPPMSRMRMMMARMKGMKFEGGGKVSTAKKNKSSPNW